jgi:transposase
VTPFIPFVTETLQQYPRLRATRLFDMVKARGYPGSVRTLREFVATVRPTPKAEVFVRLEPLAGEQAQVDWAHVGHLPVPGGQRALWAFVMVLSFSRGMWAELVFDLDAASVRRSLVRAVQALGGCTRQWLFDNPKTIVLGRVGDVVRFHPTLLEVASHYHVQPRLCAVRKPQQKGKVERAIRFLKERFFAARTIPTLGDGNAQLAEWIVQVAHARPHPVRRDRTIVDCLREEQVRLLPLPTVHPPLDEVVSVTVDATASVCFDGNTYSVPPVHAGKARTLAADQDVVRVLEGTTVLATHPRNWGRGQRVEDAAHRAAVLATKPGTRDLKGRDRLRAEIPHIDVLLQRWLLDGHHLGGQVLHTLRLLEAYGPDVLRAAVAEMVQRGTHDRGALVVLCERHRRARREPVPVPLELGAHVPEREVIPHALEGYDDVR